MTSKKGYSYLEIVKKLKDLVFMSIMSKTRVILPREKALMVDRFNIKIIYVPYTNKHKSQVGEFGKQSPVAAVA